MCEGFLIRLLSLSLSGACLMGLSELLVRTLGRRISPDVRRLLWLVVLFRLLCPWSPSGGLLDRGAAELQQAASRPVLTEPWEPSQEKPADEAAVKYDESTPDVMGAALTGLWAAGFGLAVLRRGGAYIRLSRALRRTWRPADGMAQDVYLRLTKGNLRPPMLRVSPAAPCPMLFGLLRPCIVLPEIALSQEELEGVLVHELTHWNKKDLWVKWLAVLGAAVHWFNPAARLLVDRLDRDCELSCDRAVSMAWERPRRARYGEMLLRLAAWEGSSSIALFSQKQRLEERLIAVMETRSYGKKAVLLGAAACLTLVLTSTALGAYTGPEAVEEQLTQLSAAAGLETTPATLSWPVAVEDTVELSAIFGGRVHPITGEVSVYGGIDLPQPAGTTVLAAADGTVLEAAYGAQGEGNYVLLRHGDMTTKYTHLKEWSVEPGQTVSVGDPIGLVGKTGTATGEHLHFEVTVDGERVDPLTWLDSSVSAYYRTEARR